MKQNLRKKALLPALSMALASVIALSGVTYAWFTTSNTAELKSMDVNVQAANGIQISLDGVKWRSTISGEDVITAIKGGTYSNSANQYPEREILPVSSSGKVTNGRLEMFYGEITGDGSLLSASRTETETTDCDYVAFDLFVKSTAEQVLTMELGSARSRVEGTEKFEGDLDAGTERAVRVAFLPMGVSATATGAQKLTGNGDVLIWEPNSTLRADGVEAQNNVKLPYKGFSAEFASVAENMLETEGVVTAVETFDGSNKDIVTLKNGINKIRVYIWLEGQDVDCINQISMGDFSTNLYFSVPAAE